MWGVSGCVSVCQGVCQVWGEYCCASGWGSWLMHVAVVGVVGGSAGCGVLACARAFNPPPPRSPPPGSYCSLAVCVREFGCAPQAQDRLGASGIDVASAVVTATWSQGTQEPFLRLPFFVVVGILPRMKGYPKPVFALYACTSSSCPPHSCDRWWSLGA